MHGSASIACQTEPPRSRHGPGLSRHAASLRGTDLRDADLSDACLIGAGLTAARLDRVGAARATVSGAVLTAAVRPADWPRQPTGRALGCR
jgi:uncharacterized protein YjbI with pentapeptide repeats